MIESSELSPNMPSFSHGSISPERLNVEKPQKLHSPAVDSSLSKHCGENNVHEKVMAFNTLAIQAKHLEKKTNDAALRRAVLGREEADCEMRRYRDEARNLRKAVEEAKRREKIVGERLETVMENFGRSKETFEHTKLVWEKEIRRAKKENFKTQSVYLKLQEELKSARLVIRTLKVDLDLEKYRNRIREQEAFHARHQLAKIEKELSHTREHIKLVEQERDVLRTIAQKEEVAHIAAEGYIPLPISTEHDEFSSPQKIETIVEPTAIVCSASSEQELDTLRLQLSWEKQCARRAHDRIEFLEVERKLNICSSRLSSQPMNADNIHVNTELIPNGISEKPSPILKEPSLVSSALDEQLNRDCKLQLPYDRVSIRKSSREQPAPSLRVYPEISEEPISKNLIQTPDCSRSGSTSSTKLYSLAENPPKNMIIPQVDVNYQDINSSNINTKDMVPPFTMSISRTSALAQIQERRGRARSIALGTPMRTNQNEEVSGLRRNISASATCGRSIDRKEAGRI